MRMYRQKRFYNQDGSTTVVRTHVLNPIWHMRTFLLILLATPIVALPFMVIGFTIVDNFNIHSQTGQGAVYYTGIVLAVLVTVAWVRAASKPTNEAQVKHYR